MFNQWKVASTIDTDDPLVKDWHLLLLAHHRMALLLLRTLPPENDACYHRAAADFRVMFAQMRTFLRSGYAKMEKGADSDLVLKAHLGFICPLYFIATLCRVRDIQRSAVEALGELRVVEGNWNSCVAYAVARTVLDIEESYKDTSTKCNGLKWTAWAGSRDGRLEIKVHGVSGDGR